jgi:hypothetical protein
LPDENLTPADHATNRFRTMADLDVRRDDESSLEPDYTVGEMILWLVGILAIPLVPILMVWFLTPWSGM